jgi:hypothetical protein
MAAKAAIQWLALQVDGRFRGHDRERDQLSRQAKAGNEVHAPHPSAASCAGSFFAHVVFDPAPRTIT